MLLIFFLRFFLLCECDFTCVVLALDNDIYTLRSNYIPLYSIGRTNQTSCNNSRTHSPSNWTVNVADTPDGKLCEVQQSSNLAINKTCNDTTYLIETNCFNTSEVDLTFTVHCEDEGHEQKELATVRIGIGDCYPYELTITNCNRSNLRIENLQINALHHFNGSDISGDFGDCRELISDFTDGCALTCDNETCFFNPRCLNGFDTRCFVKKYAVAEFTCAPREDLFFQHIVASSDSDDFFTFFFNISCYNKYVIDITDVQIWNPEITNTCHVKRSYCPLTVKEMGLIKKDCNNKSNCSITKVFDSPCANRQNFAFFRTSYIAEDKNIEETPCLPVNKYVDVCQAKTQSFQNTTFFPKNVDDCVLKNNITVHDTLKSINTNIRNNCRGSSSSWTILPFEKFVNHSCFVFKPHIKVTGSCKFELILATPTDDFNGYPSSSQSGSSTERQLEISDPSSKGMKQTNKVSVGSIVGGVFGSTIVVIMLILVLVFMYRRRSGLGDKGRYGNRKIPIRRHSEINCTGVQNFAFPSDNGEELHTTGLQNDSYHVIPDDPMNLCDKKNHSSELFAETNGYCLAKPITGIGVDKQKTKSSAYEMAKPLPKDSNEDHSSTMGNYVAFTSGIYNHTNITNRFHSDDINHYGIRGSDTYDTTNNQTRTRKSETDHVNPYDIRISGTYDTAKLHTNFSGQDMSDDINPYDLRVSGIYDTTQQVAGRHKINGGDDSVNDYDHFIGQKTDENYDKILEK